jgi:hypothetical protein
MATAQSIKDKIAKVIYAANQITKENDTTLYDVVLRLLGGYNAADAVNAAVKTFGVDPTVERISAGDFVRLIPSWGSGALSANIGPDGSVAIVPLSDSKAVIVNTSGGGSTVGYEVLWAHLLSAEGMDTVVVDRTSGSGALPRAGTPIAAVALSDTKVLVVCQNYDTNTVGEDSGQAIVLTVEGDTLSVSSKTIFGDNYSIQNLSLTALTDSKALVVFNNSSWGSALTLTVEGTTVTEGPILMFDDYARKPKVVALTDSKVLVAYESYDGSNGRAIVLECPGTTVTKGSAYTFRTTSTSDLALTPLDQRRALLAYRDAATTGYLYATILQVTNASVTTTNSPTLQLTDYGGNKPEVTRVDKDKVLVVANFLDSSSGSEIRAQVLTVGESKITKGAALVLKSGSTRDEARAVATLPNGSALTVIGSFGMGEGNVRARWFGLDINGTTVSKQMVGGTSVVPLTTTKYPIGVAKTSGVPGTAIFVYRAGALDYGSTVGPEPLELLQGKWTFKETPTLPSAAIEQGVRFYAVGRDTLWVKMTPGFEGRYLAYTDSEGGIGTPYQNGAGGWVSGADFRTVTFVGTQEVSRAFYIWFIANAVKIE